MRLESIYAAASSRITLGLLAGALLTTPGATAQETEGTWKFAASTGGYVSMSALIRAADSADTHLTAGPAFALQAQYDVNDLVSAYVSGLTAFETVHLGSSIQTETRGPSNQAILVAGTAGVILSSSNLLGEQLQPTLRLGGGIKAYSFDLRGAESQVQPTGDFGLGIRAGGSESAFEGTVEIRYLPGVFDQAKLPTRGIVPQDQQQHDIAFSIGIVIRP